MRKTLLFLFISLFFYNLCYVNVSAYEPNDTEFNQKLFCTISSTSTNIYDNIVDNDELEEVFSSQLTHKIPDYKYFIKLGNCHGYNIYGTCTIVSSQILFNYYDTFYNDDLVREMYDFTQNINNDSYDCATTFSNTESGLQTAEYFHQFLIGFAGGLDLDILDHGAYAGDQYELIESYLLDRNIGYTVQDAAIVNTNTGNYDVLNKIKSIIDSGKPVIVNAYGHSTVAFAYDNEYLYFHSGWGDIRKIYLTDYTDGNVDFLDIIPNSTILLSNNYYLTKHNMFVSPREEIDNSYKNISFDSSGSYTIKSSSINDYNIEFRATGTVYVSMYTDVDREIDFTSIQCPYEYDYYSDIGGINDDDYDYDAMITVWEVPEGGSFNFNILDANFDIIIVISTI